ARAAEEALAAVVEHPNELVRDQYLMLVADRCRLDPAMLRPVAARLLESPREMHDRRHRGPEGSAKPTQHAGAVALRKAPAPSTEAQRPGLEALRLAVHRPDSVAARLEPFVFLDPLQRHAFEILAETEDLQQALDLAEERDPELAGLLRRLMVEEPTADADDVVVQLVRIASRRALADVETEARLSPDAIERLAPVIAQVRADLDDLDEATGGIIAADRLLAWLSERHGESG
ncbi:MAG TPA: hypothetical protein VK428_00040, partial [Acidimicrobiales bacterium]|nr:hypothetical protein [Acidimicrobiales bacterium]